MSSTSRPFSVGAALGFARTRLRTFAPRYFALLAGWVLVWVLVEALVIGSGTAPGAPLWLAAHASYSYMTSFFEAAILDLALASRDGRAGATRSILTDGRLAARFTAVKLLLLPPFLAGTALLVLPGSLLLGRLGFAPCVLVDRRTGPASALAESAGLGRGAFWRAGLFYFALTLLNVVGAGLLGLGLLLTAPLTTLAYVHAYRCARREAGAPEA